MHFPLFQFASKALYVIAATVLLLLSLSMIGMAIWALIGEVIAGESLQNRILESVGLIIISVAVFDVAKFLVEEEVIRDRERRSAGEARRSLTKFMTIIIIAVSLEALVVVFQTAKDAPEKLLYPAGLFAAAVFAMIGLALLQRLSRPVETPAEDRAEIRPKVQERTKF